MDKRDRELQNLKEENERLQARLSLLSEVSRRISSSLDLEAVLQEVIDAACQLTSARYGALGVFDDSGNLQAFSTKGTLLCGPSYGHVKLQRSQPPTFSISTQICSPSMTWIRWKIMGSFKPFH